MPKNILVVDDEPHVRLTYRMTLEAEGYAVHEAASGAPAMEALAREQIDLATLDLRMPGQGGLSLLAEMRNRQFLTPTIIITAHGDLPDAVCAMKLGAIDFLQKPLTPEALREAIARVLERHAAPVAEANEERDDFESHLAAAQRHLNLQEFEQGWKHLSRALELNHHSPEALNLSGAWFEMQQDFGRARKLYGKAARYGPDYAPALLNKRRLDEMLHHGSTAEPMALGDYPATV